MQKKLSNQPPFSKQLGSFLLKCRWVAVAAPRGFVFQSFLFSGIAWGLPSPNMPLHLAFFYDRGCRDSLDAVIKVLRVGYVAVPRPREIIYRIPDGVLQAARCRQKAALSYPLAGGCAEKKERRRNCQAFGGCLSVVVALLAALAAKTVHTEAVALLAALATQSGNIGLFTDMPRSEFCEEERACTKPLGVGRGALRQRLAARTAGGAAFQALPCFWRLPSPFPPSGFQRLVARL